MNCEITNSSSIHCIYFLCTTTKDVDRLMWQMFIVSSVTIPFKWAYRLHCFLWGTLLKLYVLVVWVIGCEIIVIGLFLFASLWQICLWIIVGCGSQLVHVVMLFTVTALHTVYLSSCVGFRLLWVVTIRDAILTCARKPTWVHLIYLTETTTKKCKTEKVKSKNGYAQK